MTQTRLTKESVSEGYATFITELESKPQFTILSSLVSNSTASVADAVQKLLQLTTAAAIAATENREERALGDHLYYTSCCILEVAMRTLPANQLKLVQFLQQLLSITLTVPQTNEPLKHDGRLVWKDLPTFNYTLADEMHKYSPTDPGSTPDDQRRWENKTAFVAQLTAASEHTDFAVWALAAFNEISIDAFAPGVSPEHPVRAACLWIRHAGEKLWVDVKNERRLELTSPEDDPDFGLVVWKEWKASLVTSRANLSDEETKNMVQDALATMESFEN